MGLTPGRELLIEPQFAPPLDGSFRPAALVHRQVGWEIAATGSASELVLGLERADGTLSRYETMLFPTDHPRAGDNLWIAERLLKFLLWQRGGWRIYAGGPEQVTQHLQQTFAPDGARAFDARFMGQDVYEREFTVIPCMPTEVPAKHETEKALGRHLEGCRIGFDLGASDLKVSAVRDGQVVFSTEIEWNPREQNDPGYHRERILAAIKLASSKLPQVDGIGGSSAGVYIDNRPMIASLFRGIPEDRYDEVHRMFLDIRNELGVPLEIVNDGEVTALAGSMSLGDNGVLGIAMGSSQAAGYVTRSGNITNWLNELAFAPVDYSLTAPVDEWSGDRGCGAQYFSQQAVFRLAPQAGIDIPADLSKAQKLAHVQEKLEAGHNGAIQIWQTMGIYLGYALAHYSDFYPLDHVLILGRCTSGSGGPLMLEAATEVLRAEFPELADSVQIHLPDYKSRRVGQSIAAASLPEIDRKGAS